MGSVYLAVHDLLHTKAAIKVLHPALSADANLRSRFLKEAATLSGLSHPNIVRVLDFFENKDGLFIIMEYVSGIPLDEMIKTKTGPIPEDKAFRIFEKILNGFQYAHSRKPAIIHRDIKPGNIIIDEYNEPKIIDFGIVKIIDTDAVSSHTMTGTKIGTPSYMSPEQILGRDVDARSDIFSLGITLFTMLTGRSPFDKTLSEFEIHNTIINNPLPRAKDLYPGVSEKAQQIIDKATAKKKENRYRTCNEFIEAIRSPINETVIATPAPVYKSYEEAFPTKKSNAGIIIAAVAAIAVVIIFIVANRSGSSKNDPPDYVVNTTPETTTVVTPTVYPKTEVVSTAVPVDTVEVETTNTNPEANDDETRAIRTIMNNYFLEDNKSADEFNIDQILSFYQFPVEKYYNISNAYYPDVYKQIDFYINSKLNSHNLTVDWESSRIKKYGNRYYVYLNGLYEWTTKKDPSEYKSRNTSDIFVLNENYKIISVYSNPVSK